LFLRLIQLIVLAEQHPDHPLLQQRALQAIEKHRMILLALREWVPLAARPALERVDRAQEAIRKAPVPPDAPGASGSGTEVMRGTAGQQPTL